MRGCSIDCTPEHRAAHQSFPRRVPALCLGGSQKALRGCKLPPLQTGREHIDIPTNLIWFVWPAPSAFNTRKPTLAHFGKERRPGVVACQIHRRGLGKELPTAAQTKRGEDPHLARSVAQASLLAKFTDAGWLRNFLLRSRPNGGRTQFGKERRLGVVACQIHGRRLGKELPIAVQIKRVRPPIWQGASPRRRCLPNSQARAG